MIYCSLSGMPLMFLLVFFPLSVVLCLLFWLVLWSLDQPFSRWWIPTQLMLHPLFLFSLPLACPNFALLFPQPISLLFPQNDILVLSSVSQLATRGHTWVLVGSPLFWSLQRCISFLCGISFRSHNRTLKVFHI